ncbi:unnamed protein product [Chrysoparadoxa australica]
MVLAQKVDWQSYLSSSLSGLIEMKTKEVETDLMKQTKALARRKEALAEMEKAASTHDLGASAVSIHSGALKATSRRPTILPQAHVIPLPFGISISGRCNPSEFVYFRVLLDSPGDIITIKLESQDGDPDLFVSHEELPTLLDHQWESTSYEEADIIRIRPHNPNYSTGNYFVGVMSSCHQSNFTISAECSQEDDTVSPHMEVVNNLVGNLSLLANVDTARLLKDFQGARLEMQQCRAQQLEKEAERVAKGAHAKTLRQNAMIHNHSHGPSNAKLMTMTNKLELQAATLPQPHSAPDMKAMMAGTGIKARASSLGTKHFTPSQAVLAEEPEIFTPPEQADSSSVEELAMDQFLGLTTTAIRASGGVGIGYDSSLTSSVESKLSNYSISQSASVASGFIEVWDGDGRRKMSQMAGLDAAVTAVGALDQCMIKARPHSPDLAEKLSTLPSPASRPEVSQPGLLPAVVPLPNTPVKHRYKVARVTHACGREELEMSQRLLGRNRVNQQPQGANGIKDARGTRGATGGATRGARTTAPFEGASRATGMSTSRQARKGVRTAKTRNLPAYLMDANDAGLGHVAGPIAGTEGKPRTKMEVALRNAGLLHLKS